jgi:hypothetical protein
MNNQNAISSNSNLSAEAANDAEATLRLIAGLPAPEGLENRVMAGVRSAPRSGRVLNWPGLLKPTDNWLRTAAAAAIMFVIVGGGWGVYSRIQPGIAKAVPSNTSTSGGFSNAGAVRVPQTLPAPIVAQPAPVQPSAAKPAEKVRRKSAPTAARKAYPQPSASGAK